MTSASLSYKLEILWLNVAVGLLYHCVALQGFYYIFTNQVKCLTLVCTYVFFICSSVGTTAGAHRLWCHNSYKAKLPLRLLLAFFFTIAFQDSIFVWVRNHRVHHKYTETNADPYGINRGFFFAHMGWLFVKKHPDVITKGKTIDVSDLLDDPVVAFQHKYRVPLGFSISLGLAPFICWYFWNEDMYIAFAVAGVLRFVLNLHITFLVNSVAHKWGNKPYDKSITAVENKIVSYLAVGEGWHNYHHTFPWDYKTSELGSFHNNFTTTFIDFMAKIGWAYDLKTASGDIIQKTKEKNSRT